ncbi:MAG: hypothetical protein ACE5JS_20185 [Nitrospinota bacterium]
MRILLRFVILLTTGLLAAGCGGGDSEVISGEIRVAPDLVSEIPRNPLLIVQAHRAGAGSKVGEASPPVAEQRVRNPKFPLTYFLGTADLKQTGGLTGPLVISARVLSDELSGDSAKPIALEGRSDGDSRAGRRGVDIVIRNRVKRALARGPEPRTTSPRPVASANQESISGAITVSPVLGEPPSGGVLFIIVRRAGVSSGPPLAVKRLRNPGFPARYEVTEADVMIRGMPFRGPVDVAVRLDRDGRVGVEPGDLEGKSEQPARVGDRGVDVVLDKRRQGVAP